MPTIDRKRALRKLLDYIGGLESGTKDESGYDSHLGNVGGKGMKKPLSQMTIKEVKEWQESHGNKAVGRYQFIPDTLDWMVSSTKGVDENSLFNAETQNKLAETMLVKKGFDKVNEGTLGIEEFRNKVADIWAGVSNTDGVSQYEGDEYGNKHIDNPETTNQVFSDIFNSKPSKEQMAKEALGQANELLEEEQEPVVDKTPNARQQQKNTNPQAPGNSTKEDAVEEPTEEEWANAPEGESTSEEGWYDEHDEEEEQPAEEPEQEAEQESEQPSKEESKAPSRNEENEMLRKKILELEAQLADKEGVEQRESGGDIMNKAELEEREAELKHKYSNHPTLSSYKYMKMQQAMRNRKRYQMEQNNKAGENPTNVDNSNGTQVSAKASFGMALQGGLGALGSLTDIYADSHGQIEGDNTYGNLKMASTMMHAGSDLAGNLDQWHKDKPQRIQEEADRINARKDRKAIDSTTGKTKYQMDLEKARENRRNARRR